jgi:hypothetical protein
MRYLLDRMNPAIGTTGTEQIDATIGDKSKRRLEILLYGIAMWLTLPATVSGSRIFDTKRVFHQPDPTPSFETNSILDPDIWH